MHVYTITCVIIFTSIIANSKFQYNTYIHTDYSCIYRYSVFTYTADIYLRRGIYTAVYYCCCCCCMHIQQQYLRYDVNL